MNFRSILVVTYGRSGSTLLQGILNSIDGVQVKGENSNFLYGAYTAYMTLIKARTTYGSSQSRVPIHPWYGIEGTQPERWAERLWPVVQEVLFGDAPAGTTCFGFKEIRYFEIPLGELPGYLDFLSALFPDTSLIFNTRRHDDVLKSGWWPKLPNPEGVRAKLIAFENALTDYSVRCAPRCHFVRYEDLVNAGPSLLAMFEFLGAPFKPERYAQIVARPHSYKIQPPIARGD